MPPRRDGITVGVVNPAGKNYFDHLQLGRGKAERIDARAIAEFARTIQPGAWMPPPAAVLQLRYVGPTRHQLVKNITAYRNQLQANEVCTLGRPAHFGADDRPAPPPTGRSRPGHPGRNRRRPEADQVARPAPLVPRCRPERGRRHPRRAARRRSIPVSQGCLRLRRPEPAPPIRPVRRGMNMRGCLALATQTCDACVFR